MLDKLSVAFLIRLSILKICGRSGIFTLFSDIVEPKQEEVESIHFAWLWASGQVSGITIRYN